MLDEVALQAAATHDEMHVDPGEDPGVAGGAFGAYPDLAAGHVLAALPEDYDHVVRGAAARSDQYHLHRPGCQVAAATVGRAVHGHKVIAAGFGDKCHALASPAHRALHI